MNPRIAIRLCVVALALFGVVANNSQKSSLTLTSASAASYSPLQRAYRSNRVGIRTEVLRERVTYLASGTLQGRGSGTAGNERAAQYVAAAFKKAGLKPLGTHRQFDAGTRLDRRGYYQPFMFTAGVERGANNRLGAVVNGTAMTARPRTEFEPAGVSASGRAEGRLVFAGYGIESKEPARSDYGLLDVKDKIVLLLAGAPTTDPHSPLQELAGIRRKAMTAREKGARAIIAVLPNDTDAPEMSTDSAGDAGIPILILKRTVAARWLESEGKNLGTLEARLASAPFAFETEITVKLAADVRKVTRTTANIAGLLEGSAPALKNEYLVIGAHMDHLGMGGPQSLAQSRTPGIHHGADDNASGTAGVMELADYFASLPERPKRSIVFIAFSGEELGLLGSAHYTKNPLVPLENTVAMLNMDMIGRMQNNRLVVVGTGSSPSWPALIDELNTPTSFSISKSESGFGASDQQSFYLQKIPVLFFFTGLHADYHKPSDTAEKINYSDHAKVVDFVARCARNIADAAQKPQYQQIVSQDTAPAARFRVSLGSIPDYAAEVEGVMLSGVRPGSPAEKAGLKAGDVIVKFGGKDIRNVQEYTIALADFKPGDEVEIVVKRGSETVTLKAVLAAPGR